MSDPVVTIGPNLRVAEVRIQDFRAIKDLWTPIRPNLVLLGENNSGKTAFLAALDVALGSARGRVEDLRKDEVGKTTSRFVIEVRFEPLVGDEFDEPTAQVLGNGPIQLKGNEPPFFAIRCKGELDARRGDVTLKRVFLKGWARERSVAEKLSELASVQVSREHRYLFTFNLLDARRDAVEQLRNSRTFWGQVVSDLRLSEPTRQEIEQTLASLGSKLKDGSLPLTALQKELSEIRSVIAHPRLDVEVAALPLQVKDLLRAMDLLLTEAGQTALPMSAQGMGTRSLSALLIFRAFVHSVLAAADGPGTLSVAAFEEPEAHLHPQAQRAVLGAIKAIPGQRIISTHSPYVAAAADIFDIRVFRRTAEGARCAWVNETDGNGSQVFSGEQLTHLRRFVQLRHGEVLFARVVGLFEGDTEEAALPTFANAHWHGGADAAGVSLVNVGGAGNYKHVVVALTALGIPWIVFSDGDPAGVEGLAAAGKALSRTLDDSSPEVVMLPRAQDFEAYLLAEGLRADIEKSILRFFGAHHSMTTRSGTTARGAKAEGSGTIRRLAGKTASSTTSWTATRAAMAVLLQKNWSARLRSPRA
jgi:putative ATP-dependent endonuclease of OLD family